jgi:hypothetical protein
LRTDLAAHGPAVQSDIAMTLISAIVPKQSISLREHSHQNVQLEARLIGN